jgi:adenylylsulfate kinase
MPKKTVKKSPEAWKRSLVKSISYRLFIMVLDFTSIRLFTGRSDIAVGFVLVSNVYTTVAYYLHERLWNRIKWGIA